MKVVYGGVVLAGALLMVACDKSGPQAPSAQQAAPAEKLAAAEVTLKDTAENLPNGLIAISYDAAVGQYKGLADLVQKHAADASSSFKTKLANAPAAKGVASKPTLSLGYSSISNTTHFAAVALNGSEFVSGSAATPILQRWVWLPTSKSLLTPEQFVPKGIASIVARGAGGKLVGMEPLASKDGKVSAVNFVFTSNDEVDAVNKVTMTAAQLRDIVDPKYQSLLASETK